MADTVARVVEVLVGLVYNPHLALRAQILPELGAWHVEQRPNDPTPARIDAREPGQPGAPHQLQQERLGLVVLRVTNGDPVGADIASGPFQEVVSDAASGVFDRGCAGPGHS